MSVTNYFQMLQANVDEVVIHIMVEHEIKIVDNIKIVRQWTKKIW